MLGPEHPDTLTSMANLAGDYYSQGKYAQAEAALTARPWRSGAACWARSIPTR